MKKALLPLGLICRFPEYVGVSRIEDLVVGERERVKVVRRQLKTF